MSKQYKDNISDQAQESLVDALENIKNLLAKSEDKLSAARESIALANSSSSRAKVLSSEENIPVLEEEIIPTLGDEVQPDLVFDSSAFADFTPEPAQPVIQGISSEDVMDLIDEFQDRLPAILNKTITNCSLSSLETDLFEVLKKELHQLRNEVKTLDH